VITCSRCGKIIPGGQTSCQYCGMPVMNRSEYVSGAGKTNPDQPELPAWLQSLRAGTQPTYTTGNNTNFSASDLVEEGALPGWMQPGHPDASQGLTGPHPVLRPSSMSAPNTDGAVLPNGSMSAGSLIDEQSLPSWMREHAGEEQGMAASSLIQPEALPAWLREAQGESARPQPAQPVQPAPQAPSRPVQPQTPPAIMSVPPASSWSGAQPGQPASPQAFAFQPAQAQGQMPPQPQPPPSVFPAQGLSAQDLIDPQSLPPWLAGQPGAPTGGAALPASSLLDMNALPPWLRENGQGSPQGQATMNGSPAAPAPSQQQPQGRPAAGGNLAAASFIDMDALPDWLRASGDGQPDLDRRGGMAPRAENVRVPGRPRGGVGPQESSAAAANVFASMLGVSSNAPMLPNQSQPGPQGQPPFQPSQPMPPLQGTMPGQIQGQIPAQAQGYPGPMQGYGPQSYQQGQPGPQGQPPYQAGYPMGNQPGVSQPPAAQAMPAPGGQTGQTKQTKSPRRGFLDTIREWFGLNS